ncbi:MAG TPA: hypothetical protein VJU80_09040 [Solirubrobacteraceae bacterium]|nr:hypothetical protein [Solirubrobacteraceae bacterium]
MSIQQWEQSGEVALSTPQDVAVHRLGEWAQSADAAYQVAERLSSSAFVPAQFKGKPVELTAAILSGLEVGLSPMAAMRSFDIIQGQAAPRAITLRAVVQSHGHEMVLVESTATRCRMKGRRRGSEEWQSVSWTIERARDLGLVGKDNWKKQPAAMLVARATSELARLIASDAILGIGYSAEEVADGGAYDEQVAVETTTPSAPAAKRTMSRRKPANEDGSPARDEEGQMKAMHAAFNDAGISERQDRLDFAMATINREIESSSDLTWDERSAVIDALKDRIENPFSSDDEPLDGEVVES